VGSISKNGMNQFQAIDLPALALELGASFVARSFSGDKTQLIPLIKAAISHHGFALIDVISPCVTFNNNTGSTKAYDYVREHITTADVIDYVPPGEEITMDYPEGTSADLTLHDGSMLQLTKLAPNWDPRDKLAAMQRIYLSRAKQEILTGLLYIDPNTQDLHDLIGTVATPLNELLEEDLCPGSAVLEEINRGLR
jgi:2-oxoglutarate ferredoxin oxidoreductase subunit beta